jgi:hypothetical protein
MYKSKRAWEVRNDPKWTPPPSKKRYYGEIKPFGHRQSFNMLWIIYIFGAFMLLLAFRKLFGKAKSASNTTIVDPSGIPTKSLTGDAKRIYTAFGFDFILGLHFPWEDEEAIIKILRDYNKPQFSLLGIEYSKMYNRILTDDLKRYLSNSDLKQLAHVL